MGPGADAVHVLHHTAGATTGFDWVDAVVVIAVVGLLAAVGFAAWTLLRRREYG